MQAEDTSQKDRDTLLMVCRRHTINNPSWINNDVKQAIGRRQRAYETKRRINTEETIARVVAARREVKEL